MSLYHDRSQPLGEITSDHPDTDHPVVSSSVCHKSGVSSGHGGTGLPPPLTDAVRAELPPLHEVHEV